MKKYNLVKKPVLFVVALVFVIGAIAYIEAQKPNIPNFNSGNTETNIGNTAPDDAKLDAKTQEIITSLGTGDARYPLAPDFVGIEKWLNSEPLKMEQLRGKVVLVDFWTYTCINCIRTLPYLKSWDEKYRDKGLVIVGVHTPEFEFEKKYENVLKAINDYEIKYPVAQDNYYATWQSYQNRYWPHKFLIDIYGRVRYDHIGEGSYDETEKVIQELLKERMEKLGEEGNFDDESSIVDAETVDGRIGTPEIYLGYQFSRGNFGNEEGFGQDTVIDYVIPSKIKGNNVYLEGRWQSNPDNMELLEDSGAVLLVFDAKSANIVAGSDAGSEASIFLDSVKQSTQNVNEFKLYNVANADKYGQHYLKINIKNKGFKLYTFTFG